MTFIMATSSSDESSTAPKDFQLSSSLDSGSRLSPSRRKCPLCCAFRKSFYCKDCISSGDFYPYINTETYSEKQLRFAQLKSNCKTLENTCLELLDRKQKIDVVSSKIKLSRERIHTLKLAIEERERKNRRSGRRLVELQQQNEKLAKSLPKYEERVQRMETYVVRKQVDIGEKFDEITVLRREFKKVAQKRIGQLMQYVFPIGKVEPKAEVESSESDMLMSELAEASHTMYIRDRWVTDNSGEMQYSIVAPCLPASGNYSDYNVWVAQNKDSVTCANANVCVELNPAYKISAALTYTAQLVQMLAFYLDIWLPYKMSISDFCSSGMNQSQFSRRVARLNANILHLCFSQNTALNTLRPSETIHNILQLIDVEKTDLGRQGPMELDPVMTNSLEQQLGPNLETGEDSDSEEGDMLPVEWEAVSLGYEVIYNTAFSRPSLPVPHVQLPEACAGPINLQSTQMISTQASSMAGGLVTSAAASIASIWRGWTGR